MFIDNVFVNRKKYIRANVRIANLLFIIYEEIALLKLDCK